MGDGLSLIILGHKRVKTDVHLLVYDEQAEVTGTVIVPRGYSHVAVTRSVTKERAKEIETENARLGIKSRTRKFGGLYTEERYYVSAFLAEPDQKNDLAPEYVVESSEVNAPRSNPFLRASPAFKAVAARLEELNYSRVDEWHRGEQEYRIVRSLAPHRRSERRFELAPVKDGAFRELATEVIRKDPLLRDHFQTYEYVTENLSEKDAKAVFNAGKKALNGDRWFRHDLRMVRSTVGNSVWRKPVWTVRCHSALYPGVDEPNHIEAFTTALPSGQSFTGLRAKEKPGCHRARRDTAQQDDQAHFLEIPYPTLHRLRSLEAGVVPEQLSVPDVKRLAHTLENHIVAIDLETTGYLKSNAGPKPSGAIAHAVLRSKTEKILFVTKDYLPGPNTVEGYSIVTCDNEVDLIARLNEACKPYVYVFCHNGRGFDEFHLRKANSRITEREIQEKLKNLRRNAPTKFKDDETFWVKAEKDLRETAETVNYFRPKGANRVWSRPSIADSFDFVRKRPGLRVGAGLEPLTGEDKEDDYDTIEKNFTERTPQGLLENAIYTAHDGERTWSVALQCLPLMLAEMVATGRTMQKVASSRIYHNMTDVKNNNALRRGKHYRSHVVTRQALERIEDTEKDAALEHGARRIIKTRTGLFDSTLWRSPIIARAFRHELGRVDAARILGELALDGDPFLKINAVAAAEYYVTPFLVAIDQILRAEGRMIDSSLSRADFQRAFTKAFGDYDPSSRLAGEHQFSSIDLYQKYQHLHAIRRDIVEHRARGAIDAHIGQFMLGALPPAYDNFRIGNGRFVVFGKDKFLGVLTDDKRLPLVGHGVTVPKIDAGARNDIRRAVLDGSPLQHEPKHAWTKSLYRRLEGVLDPASFAHMQQPSLFTEPTRRSA